MALFKKKGGGISIVEYITKHRETGVSDREIIEDLREQGHKNQEILDGLKKADMKSASGAPIKKIEPAFEDDELEELEPKPAKKKHKAESTGDTEALVEKIVEEKWASAGKEIKDLKKWKEEVTGSFEEVKKKVEEVATSIELFKKTITEKLGTYSQGISDVSTDIQAMDKVFKDILPQLTSDVGELSSIVTKLKK